MPGFSCVRKDILSQGQRGLCILIRSHIEFQILHLSHISHHSVEIQGIKIFEDLGVIILNDCTPTLIQPSNYRRSVIDLCIVSSNLALICSSSTLDDSDYSDHLPVKLQLGGLNRYLDEEFRWKGLHYEQFFCSQTNKLWFNKYFFKSEEIVLINRLRANHYNLNYSLHRKNIVAPKACPCGIFTDGRTNKLIGIWYMGHYTDMILVRIYGNNSDLLIDRKSEIKNIRILNKAGYTHCIYATFNNGFAYEFLEGETLTTETVKNPKVYPLIAKRMAEMHNLESENESISKDAFIWEKIKKFMQIIPKRFSDSLKQAKFEMLIPSYAILEKEYQLLKSTLSKVNSPVVFAHNDLLLGNILYNQKQESVVFIDYEYTALNYQAFDIVNHFTEFAGFDEPDYSLYPDENFQKMWLKKYLQIYNATTNVSEKDVDKLYWQVTKFTPLPHFFWGCWALIQSEHSHIDFDFLE
ncbi:Ethanolamine kinase 1 [Trachymyrmex septentrionalis]|uniref:ethanolamine kinase n=1 Tax=Trachymyrmex septentrionalis TaxID=34720 RepID=A0A151JX54_9HYME|nr:Ethanolamine kinase 1 [Trachymyrmex septentrionalis]